MHLMKITSINHVLHMVNSPFCRSRFFASHSPLSEEFEMQKIKKKMAKKEVSAKYEEREKMAEKDVI